MATVTASLATSRVSPKRLHAGANVVRVKYTGSANTLSDIVLLAKVPNGAIITDMNGVFFSSNVDSVIKVGWSGADSGSATAFGTHTASTTDATTNWTLTGEDLGPVHISFTDSTGSAAGMIYATCSAGTFSDSFSLDITFTYHMDHNEGQGS